MILVGVDDFQLVQVRSVIEQDDPSGLTRVILLVEFGDYGVPLVVEVPEVVDEVAPDGSDGVLEEGSAPVDSVPVPPAPPAPPDLLPPDDSASRWGSGRVYAVLGVSRSKRGCVDYVHNRPSLF